jgi:uncharacterized protein (TIGR00296 family)
MLSLTEGTTAVHFARHVITEYVSRHPSSTQDLGKSFKEKQGVFVTLHTYPDHDLRGCIGIPLPVMNLQDAIIEAAQSATQDPRFPRLAAGELDAVIVEVTVLTPPVLIKVKNPREYPGQVMIGRDGLIVEQGFYKGLLLPQVPFEQHWDTGEFLSHTCMKAGLLPDAWLDPATKISRFSGQIFSEEQPHGAVKEMTLHGSDH